MFRKLRARIIEKYGTQKAFAEALGVSTNLISLKMTKRVEFSKDDILKWGEMLEISPEQFYEYFFLVTK